MLLRRRCFRIDDSKSIVAFLIKEGEKEREGGMGGEIEIYIERERKRDDRIIHLPTAGSI